MLYAAILTIMFLWLSSKVIQARQQQKTALGHGQSWQLQQRMRAHANFAEYTPLALLLMAMLEYQDAHLLILHALGILYVTGRILHAYGIMVQEQYNQQGTLTTSTRYRRYGMISTFTTLALCAGLHIIYYAYHMLTGS